MLDASLTITANAPAPAPAPAPAAHPGFFSQFLSELNPLQYVPVVGTIYRAVTGDTIPESARFAGSLVVSGLTGGPVGIGINVGTTMVEHLLGIDPEKIGDEILSGLGIGSGGAKPTALAKAPTAAPAAAPVAQAAAPASSPVPASSPAPAVRLAAAGGWSPLQLAAYGVRQSPQGELSRGKETGADVLNGLELAQLQGASAAA